MLKRNICNFVGFATITAVMAGVFSTCNALADNARTALSSNVVHARGASGDNGTQRRSTTGAAARTTTSRSAAVSGRVSARGAITSNAMRGASSVPRVANSGSTMVSRSAAVVRSAVPSAANTARSAVSSGASRANIGRATAVFSDISKIGGGYAQCREAYATCMDQFCANANDTYRRCYCSQRFTEFRDTEEALDQAKTLLMQFEDNNLNAVDKSAAEVNAMYSATVGEMAIKKDTSGAAQILDQIGDLLSGKKKTTNNTSSSGSLGVLSLDFSTDINDVWGGGSSGAIFGKSSGQNLAELEGTKLYDASNSQCTGLVADSCESDAVLQMARSSYNIMITQDCNAYAKNIDSKREAVKQTVRTAEKYLREARLEEYRSHNSADVNECLNRVKTALLADTACGANYKRCLDYTGAYVSQTTGDPIYSPRLFELNDVIKLAGVNSGGADNDVLKQNDAFNKFLDTKRIFATSALDSCRDIADTVWTEFKRTALIEIAQAQDEKIEEVKMSCVSTMAECYDRQTSSLKDFDTTTSQYAGAVSAYAAREMCADKVMACASLYGQTDGCKFDGNGKLTGGNDTTGNRCGLTALLNFVDTVDKTRINEGCETALKNYTQTLCTPTSGDMGYPWNCRLMSRTELRKNITDMSDTYCSTGLDTGNTVKNITDGLVRDITMDLASMLSEQCDKLNGLWLGASESVDTNKYTELKAFNTTVFNGDTTYVNNSHVSYGRCVESTTRVLCDAYNTNSASGTPLATFVNDTCRFSPEWYETKCVEELGGIWENMTCYIKK